MDETVLLPSPNWFLVSNLAVSSDGWLIYGGPSKSLCVLEPRKADEGVIASNEKYQAHVVLRAHSERIVAVNISPEWSEKRTLLTGSQDGVVKQWILETVNNRIKIKAQNVNDVHQAEQEDVVGVGYSSSTMAISVGGYSNVVKWDLSSNVTTGYPHLIKGLKPTCMACSPHLQLHVAVGTKQGVIFVLDLHEKGSILYKVRSQDEEVANLSWCPQYEVTVKKTFKETKSFLTDRLASIRSEGTNSKTKETNVLEQSGIGKTLPDDSFDDSIVQEDDTFDIYADHEAEEFGHKKYVPEDIVVKVKKEKAADVDYLAECLKLKEEILRRKNQTEPSIESLVDALDKTHVETANLADTEVDSAQTQAESVEASTSKAKCDNTDAKVANESSHYHKHLLASIGKNGGVRVWSKSGQLVSSSIVNASQKTVKKGPVASTILWYKADTLLIVDPKSQLMETNPLQINNKNKLACQLVHQQHKRGMYCIVTNAPRVQTETTVPSDDWSVWSASQDRNIIRYCLKSKKSLAVHSTCGGFLYTVLSCPYDAGKVAVSVGDGTIRVLEMATLPDDDTKLTVPSVVSYWQNVQGKVLTIAWHPTRENLLAFATGEARVGLLDTGGRYERPGRVLHPGLSKAVYSLCWGDGMLLCTTVGLLDTGGRYERPGRVLHRAEQGGVLAVLGTVGLLDTGGRYERPGRVLHRAEQGGVLAVLGTVGLLDTGGRYERPGRVLHPGLSKAVYSLCWGDGMLLCTTVGLLDTGGRYERPGRVLHPGLSKAVYSLCWGDGMLLCTTVGLLDTGGRYERPGRVLHPGLSKAVYSLCWGDGMLLCTTVGLLDTGGRYERPGRVLHPG
ncbi:uncharacterized protein LOC135117406 [Helicoverpa armigera]|uniref:uncharacterized protein LOC135117406 n=1 Tax=Helicoverpa armigera TaxID=29058 RepID=UPI0030826DDD